MRFPRGEDVVMHNIVQMVLLMVMVETRIDIDHTILEDVVAETIEEYQGSGCKNSNVTGGI